MIFSPGSLCRICGKRLSETDDLDYDRIRPTDNFLGPLHPLHEMGGVVMHMNCFEHWPGKKQYLALEKLFLAAEKQTPKGMSVFEYILYNLPHLEKLFGFEEGHHSPNSRFNGM